MLEHVRIISSSAQSGFILALHEMSLSIHRHMKGRGVFLPVEGEGGDEWGWERRGGGH